MVRFSRSPGTQTKRVDRGASRHCSNIAALSAALLALCIIAAPLSAQQSSAPDMPTEPRRGSHQRDNGNRNNDDQAPQSIGNEAPMRMVRANIVSRRTFEQIMNAGINPMSCRPGLGSGEYVVTREHEALLQELGITYDIIIDDLSAVIRAERERIEEHNQQLAMGLRGVSWFDDYKDIDQIYDFMDDLIASRPDLIAKSTIGSSLEGRPIYAYRISGDSATKPAVLFNGTQHAREWVSPMTVVYIADQLVQQYDTDPEVQHLVDSVEFLIVPIVNPDGYAYSWDVDRMWRKNRRENYDIETGLLDGTFGVDLNRNWDKDWGGPYSSGTTSSQAYRGPTVFSEPESQVLRDYVLDHPQLIAHIDYHSFSQEILQPWGFAEPWNEKPPDFVAVEALGQAMRQAMLAVHGFNYPNASGSGGVGLASGVMPDWTTDVGVIGYTIELRPSSSCGGVSCNGFDLPTDQIIPNCEENFAGALAMARFAIELPIHYHDGTPAIMPAYSIIDIDLSLKPRGGLVLEPATAKAIVSSSAHSTTDEIPLTHLGGDDYAFTLPAAGCGETLSYYLQIETTDGYTYNVPAAGGDDPYTMLAAGEIALNDSFETDLGWTTDGTATEGHWERGVPVNDPGWAFDPATDGDGSGQCWLTDNRIGNSDVDNGFVRLTSPALDMSGSGEWTINYMYFLRVTVPDGNDWLSLEVSSNGHAGPWVEVARHDNDGGLNWFSHTITQSDLDAAGIARTDNMAMRFTAIDGNPQSIVEAAVDAFRVYATCQPIPGDVNNDGIVNVQDLLLVISNWGSICDPGADCPGDANNDGIVNVQDLLLVISNWGATS